MAGLIGHVALEFNAAAVPDRVGPVNRDLSGVVRVWDTLFLASDQTAGIERLRLRDGVWCEHRHFEIGDFLADSIESEADEMDIEGLAVQDGWLWLTGSHAYERRRVRPGDPVERGFRRLRQTMFEPKRQFLGRLPLANLGEGLEPVKRDGGRKPAHVRFCKHGRLREWLEDDPFLADFLNLPGKENGLDIEAIAVDGMRIWLGLRGPVLGGHAVVLEMGMQAGRDGHLTARPLEEVRRYRLHLLPSDGDGIRDLVIDGEDLIVLVGTTGSNDGRSAVMRWRGALRRRSSGLVERGDLQLLVDLGYRGLRDNPEGLARWENGSWLLVHDSPATWRLEQDAQGTVADIWTLD